MQWHFDWEVLIDNSFTLNILSRYILKEMHANESYMRPNIMMARAYDGLPIQIVGTLKGELYIGPWIFPMTLYIQRSCILYNSSSSFLVANYWNIS